jgi:hypothetical protein
MLYSASHERARKNSDEIIRKKTAKNTPSGGGKAGLVKSTPS